MNGLKLLTMIVIIFFSGNLYSISNEECLDCHSDPDLSTERGQTTISLYTNTNVFNKSVHKDLDCISCHTDADVDELPHDERLKHVNCGDCHDDVQLDFDTGIHGQALKQKMNYAPTCSECHGTHNILSPKNPESISYKMKIPFLCGKCHREGAPVARIYNINEHNILENYSQSIHGEGLFRKGLIVTAACIDCHGSHMILPHTDKRSTTSTRNIAQTCMKCHSRIEEVHLQIIEGEKWERDPGAIPACTDCHLPHKARKATLALNVSDQACLKCHEKQDVHKTVNGEKISLYVSRLEIKESIHNGVPCVKCHSDVNPKLVRPCETAASADCGSCHEKFSEEYWAGGHGKGVKENVQNSPQCKTCHGYHSVKSHFDERSKTFRASIPSLCGDCHSKDSKVLETKNLAEPNAFFDYSRSIHGRKLEEKGLLPSAICTDCHSAHMVLNQNESLSSVNKKNIPATCANCHRGIYKDYIKSVHFSVDEKEMVKLPACTECHSAHKITEVVQDQFMTEVTSQCGNCHSDLAETYLETMHGKAYQLGYLKSAKCSDCHNSHLILKANDPNSSIGLTHIVTTCQKCHEDANKRFTGYLTHATHHDHVKYPILFYTYWAMTLLLISVFTFFGIHTIMWFPRSFKHLRERRKRHKEPESEFYFRRFSLSHRIMHLFVIISFMLLALTGMMLKFSGMPWAGFMADLIGGVKIAGLIHRFAALITFGYFFSHVYALISLKYKKNIPWLKFLFGPDSMMFNLNDLKDFFGTIKWFIGKGERPNYGRWTYWEKFDYFAVFWGVMVIGLSGLMLWFPEFFTKFLPGWLINVATIIHSDEALLAVGFIFTVHFFNTHLRPEAFPMDQVIFTGLVPLEEYKHDRPKEYEALYNSGELEKRLVKKGRAMKYEKQIYLFGFTFLALGILLILLIIYSVVFGYQI